MVNVYGNYSETGYNNPYSAPTPTTAAQADAGNVVGNRNRAAISGAPIGSKYGPQANEYDWSNVSFEGQQQQQRQQQSNEVQVRVVANPNEGDAYRMATEAARRGDVVDPTVLQKAREQGFTGPINETPSITPGAASRLASTRPTLARGNLYADADAFTPTTATFIGKGTVPKFSPETGSVTQRFAFDEYGKVLKGGKFEPAYNATGIPYNAKMGSGEYVYVGEFKYNTGEVVSRFYEKNVGSYVDFSEAGAAGLKAIGVRSGGSPGSYGETIRATATPSEATAKRPLVSVLAPSTEKTLDRANTSIPFYDIRATAATQERATGGMQLDLIPKRPFVSVTAGTSIEQPRGELPFVGVVPGISNVLAFFQPETIRQRKQTQLPDIIESKVSQLPERKEVALTPIPDQVITEYDPGSRTITTTTIKGVQEETTTYGGTLTETATRGGVATVVSERPGLSGFDRLNRGIRDVLRLPSKEVGEQGLRFASLANPFTAVPVVVSVVTEKFNPEAASNTRAVESLVGMRGQYAQFYEQPLLVPMSYVGGALFGAGAKGLEKVYGASRAAAAERIISTGQTARAAEQFSGLVMEKAPIVLGGLYVASIGSRATDGGTNLQPERVISKSKGIVVQEAVPMGYGFVAPSQVAKSARLSDIGYKATLQEGGTTGRLDYYVRQPAKGAYETITTPIQRAKLEFPQFVEESGGSKIVGAVKYAGYKLGTEQPVTAEIQRPAIAPENEFATGGVYERTKIDRPIAPEIQRKPIAPEDEFATGIVYQPKASKPPLPEIQRATVEPENEFATSSVYAKPTNSLIIAAKAKWQELTTPERILYFSSYGGRNFISQGLPPKGWGGSNLGGRGIPGTGTRGDGSDQSRITTRIVGGREVSGLTKEPSIKSRNEIESVIQKGTIEKIGTRADYRNAPQSPTMKPMDASNTKQAAIQIERGQAPTRLVAPERVSQPPSFGFDVRQVRDQERKGSVRVDVTPEFASAQVTGQTVAQSSHQTIRTSEVIERAQKQQIGPTYRQMQRTAQTNLTKSRQGTEISSGIKTDLTSGQDIRQSSDITQRFTQTQIPKVTPITDQFTDYNRQITITKVPGIPPDFPIPDGAPYNIGGRKRQKRFLEIFPMGLDLAMYGKRNLPRRVGRKPSKEKRKTSSKKGRK